MTLCKENLIILWNVLLISSSVLTLEAVPKLDCDQSLQSKSEGRNLTQIGDGRTKFTDLVYDVEYLILDHLNLKDLINLAKAIPRSALVANDIFRKNYKDYNVDIHCANPAGSPIKEISSSKRIQLFNFGQVVDILKMFGLHIQRLEIKTSKIISENSAIINEYVNEYASSLTHLDLETIKEDTFEQFTSPFNEVKELAFTTFTKRLRTGPFTLSQLFPKLRRLALLLYMGTNYTFINTEIPHLEHLRILATGEAWNQRDQIEGLIRKNPQIRSIEIQSLPVDYTKQINAYLPYLESLTLPDIKVDEVIHFQHVKHFTFSYNLVLDGIDGLLGIGNVFFSNVGIGQAQILPRAFRRVDQIFPKKSEFDKVAFG